MQLKLIDPNATSEPKKNLKPQDITKFLCQKTLTPVETDNSKLKSLERKFSKAKGYSNDVVLTAEYPILIQALENFAGDVCESATHFANMDVDRTLTKEKQLSQAKSIVHQKRRALADLFKTLQRIGISYRTGLNDGSFEFLSICEDPPANFEESVLILFFCDERY